MLVIHRLLRVHLRVHRVSSFQQSGTDSEENSNTDRCPATIHPFELYRNQINGTSQAHTCRGSAEAGEFADVPQRQSSDVELLDSQRTWQRQLFAVLANVLH